MNWLKKTVADAEAPKFSVIDVLKKNIGGYRPGRSFANVHASDVTKPGFCPRKRALLLKLGSEPKDEYIGTALAATFDVGVAVESLLVNKWAASALIGNWVCSSCNKATPQMTKRPGNGCTTQGLCRWKYKQVPFVSKEHGVSGSPDALFDLGGPKYFLAECKIMKVEDFNTLLAPLPEHRIRTTLYMKLIAESDHPMRTQISSRYAKILYVSRGYGKKDALHQTILPFKEFTVVRDDEVTKPVLEIAKQIKVFRDTGAMPSGVCPTILHPIAKVCSVAKQCFSGEYPATQPVLK